MVKRTIPFLLLIALLSGCQNDRSAKNASSYDPEKERQEWRLASDQIKKNNPAGLLKLWEIAAESMSAENSEIASEQVRGYLYSKPDLWIAAFSTVDFTRFRKEFETAVPDFDIYRFTSDGEIPETIAAKKIVADLMKMKGKNQTEQELINYLITYYSEFLKNEIKSKDN